MKLHRARWLRWGVWLWLACVPASARAETTAFFYSAPVPRELFQVYDQVVVQPDQAPHPSNFRGEKGQPVAYVSVGEVQAASPAARDLAPSWVLARNPAWSTLVLDPRRVDYQSYLLSRFDELWSRGYRRFFLDTLDSYRLGLHDEAADHAARAGWVNLIVALKARHP
ncbi:MAG TPA: endo alpha-1,4 polygalactosaminidase, partial [Polyangiaceae bacterium]|nr:endo alpha-1,4 polygalactosaminidase [Polyangiaceae bacterium]